MSSSFQRLISRLLLPCLLVVVTETRADLKIRPGEKIKEKPRDFTKENEKYGFPTPEPQKAEASFISGKSVEITLEASTRYLGTVKFEIREQPKHGTLGPLRQHPKKELNKMLVTYTHSGDPSQLDDSFTFVVRIDEGSTSVPARVTLKGTKSAPRLEVLENPKFRRIGPGEEDIGRGVIQNIGTETFDALLSWPPPFYGPPKLVIEPGQKQEFMIRVRPPAVGSYKLDLAVQTGVQSSTVKGILDCVLPYVVSPGTLELRYDPASGQRKGSTRVTNASDQPMTLRVDPAQRIQTVETITLPPKESVDLPIALAANDVAAFRGEVAIVQESHREKLFVTAAPEPAQAKLITPADGRIDFGTVEKGKMGEVKFIISNAGGEELLLNPSDAPPFAVSKEKPLKVAPGEQTEFILRFETDQGGKYEKTISLGGNGGAVTLVAKAVLNDPRRAGGTKATPVQNPHLDRPASGKVIRQAGPERPGAGTAKAGQPAPVEIPSSISKPPPSSAPANAAANTPATGADAPVTNAARVLAAATPLQKQVLAFASTFGFGPGDSPEQRSKTLQPVPEVGLLEAGRDHLVIGWRNPDTEPARFEVESAMNIAGKDTGLPVKTWTPVKEWKSAPAPDGASAARIDGLKPGLRYEFRVVGIDADGKYSKPSDIIMVSTLPPFKMPAWLWTLVGALVLLAGLMVYRQRMAAR